MAAAWASSPLCFAPNICLPAPFPAPTEHELLPAVTAGLQHALLPAATLLSKAGGLNPVATRVCMQTSLHSGSMGSCLNEAGHVQRKRPHLQQDHYSFQLEDE